MLQFIGHPLGGYHRVVIAEDDEGFRAIVAIHSVALGVALGGCRVMPYDTFEDQMSDALSLAKGMTYKNSLAGLDLGGGKATINAPLADHETLKKFADVMDYINKDELVYITAGDVGTGPEQVAYLASQTEFVNGQNLGEDSGFATAYGVYMAMLGAVNFTGRDMADVSVAIEGLGKVGSRLADFLHKARSSLRVSDISEESEMLAKIGYNAKPYKERSDILPEIDVYAPCALGGSADLKCYNEMNRGSIICGGANNQIPNDTLAVSFFKKGIVTVPDYLANAGGVIIVSNNYQDLSWKDIGVYRKLVQIQHKTFEVLMTARDEGITPQQVADKLAEERINA